MTDSFLTIERRGPVEVLHLDDGKANVLSPQFTAAIKAAVLAAEADDDVRALVLHGREGRFSGGFDLGIMATEGPDAVRNMVCDGADLIATCYGLGKPVIAACTGHAVAAGAFLLLGCDVRIGADVPAKVGAPEVAIKMSLPAWAVTISTERLSKRHVQRALVNARMTTPAEAIDVGFLDEVVPPEQVLDRAIAVADELAATLHIPSYAATVEMVRGDVLAKMRGEIAAARPG